MKKIILILSIIFSLSLTNVAQAQVNVSVNINSQPAWGPTGYDNANYYYFPDLNVYFDVNNSLFYYLSGSKWTSNRYLPSKYANDDLYSMYKVVINSSSPWKKNNQHQKEYTNYKNNKKQGAIKNSTDSRYDQSKKNTLAWVKNDKSENSNSDNKSNNNSSKKNNSNRSSKNNKNQTSNRNNNSRDNN